MVSDDLRNLLNPIAAVVAARSRWRTIPGYTYNPPGTEADPDPEPVTVPERTEAYIDPADLPPEIVEDGTASLNEQVALLQAAVAQLYGDIQIRSVAGKTTLTAVPAGVGLTWDAGEQATLPIVWSSAPLRTPTYADVEVDAPIALLGRTTAQVVAGSITDTGCTIRVTNTSVAPVLPTAVSPITYTARALYVFLPPFEETP